MHSATTNSPAELALLDVTLRRGLAFCGVVADPVETARRKEEKEFKHRQAQMYESLEAKVAGRNYKALVEGV